MNQQRVARVRASIQAWARAEGVPPSIAHVCLACQQELTASGVSVSLMGELGVETLLFATDSRTEQLAELQTTVGEGPGLDALRYDRPVLMSDLWAASAARRWPLFTPSAQDLGIGAVFAFPLHAGVIAVGVLKVNRAWPGRLWPEQVASAFLYADAALVLLMHVHVAGEPNLGHPGRLVDGFIDRWDEVHQATGMISVQLESSIAEAFVRLRAYAYSSDRRLSEVARDVVARRLRLERDPPPGGEPEAA